jgi:hypothetical protein
MVGVGVREDDSIYPLNPIPDNLIHEIGSQVELKVFSVFFDMN